MDTFVDMLDAKMRLSELVQAVESGQVKEIIIARNCRPAARLVGVEAEPKRTIELGLAHGRFASVSQEEFDADNEEIWKEFFEEPLPPDDRK